MNIYTSLKEGKKEEQLNLIQNAPDENLKFKFDKTKEPNFCGCCPNPYPNLLDTAFTYNAEDEVIDLLLEKGFEISKTNLDTIVHSGRTKYAKLYLDKYPDAKLETYGGVLRDYVTIACLNGYSELLKLFIKLPTFNPNYLSFGYPIFTALEEKHYNCYDLLIDCPNVILSYEHENGLHMDKEIFDKYTDPEIGHFGDEFNLEDYNEYINKNGIYFTSYYLRTIDKENKKINEKLLRIVPEVTINSSKLTKYFS